MFASLRLQLCFCFAAFLLLAHTPAGRAADAEPKPEPTGYTQVEFNALKVGIEDYKNKKVVYEGRFKEFYTTFPKYIEDSGYKPTKYMALIIEDGAVPVMVKKSGDMNEIVAGLQRGQMVRVFGKVDNFRKSPEKTMMPRFCVELSHITLIEGGNLNAGPDNAKPPVGGGRGFRDKR